MYNLSLWNSQTKASLKVLSVVLFILLSYKFHFLLPAILLCVRTPSGYECGLLCAKRKHKIACFSIYMSSSHYFASDLWRFPSSVLQHLEESQAPGRESRGWDTAAHQNGLETNVVYPQLWELNSMGCNWILCQTHGAQFFSLDISVFTYTGDQRSTWSCADSSGFW